MKQGDIPPAFLYEFTKKCRFLSEIERFILKKVKDCFDMDIRTRYTINKII